MSQEILKVVFDTNVLISASLFRGKPRGAPDLAIEGRIDGFTSPEIIREFREVLSRSKFGLTEAEVHAITEEIESTLIIVFPSLKVSAVKSDPDDNAVLECAVESGASDVITGDSHLLELGQFRDIRILTPEQFLTRFA